MPENSLISTFSGSATDAWRELPVGRIDIHIDRHGVWHHLGEIITRASLVSLLAEYLRYQDSQYYLIAPEQRLKISVEDLPFIVDSVSLEIGEGVLSSSQIKAVINVGDELSADQNHFIELKNLPESDQRIPTIHVRDGLFARFSRAAYYQLVDIGVTQCQHFNEGGEGEMLKQKELSVFSNGCKFVIGEI